MFLSDFASQPFAAGFGVFDDFFPPQALRLNALTKLRKRMVFVESLSILIP